MFPNNNDPVLKYTFFFFQIWLWSSHKVVQASYTEMVNKMQDHEFKLWAKHQMWNT